VDVSRDEEMPEPSRVDVSRDEEMVVRAAVGVHRRGFLLH